MRREGLNLSRKEQAILELLEKRGEMYGLQIVKESDGIIGIGTVYITLGRMEDQKGYVVSRSERLSPGIRGIPRRVYSITELGRQILAVVKLATQHRMTR
jgi:DNA-binding PadR family transcriptional regulator